jgi:hypothetical protein
MHSIGSGMLAEMVDFVLKPDRLLAEQHWLCSSVKVLPAS